MNQTKAKQTPLTPIQQKNIESWINNPGVPQHQKDEILQPVLKKWGNKKLPDFTLDSAKTAIADIHHWNNTTLQDLALDSLIKKFEDASEPTETLIAAIQTAAQQASSKKETLKEKHEEQFRAQAQNLFF